MKSNHNPTLTASKVALIYALISVAWILFSDQLLAATVTTVETITLMQMVKGWAFVLTTSVLIFFLMRQEMSRFFKADEAQRASESNFRLVVENSRDIILFIKKDNGQVLEANRAAATAYGYSRDELLKLRVQDLREANTVDLVPEQMAKADAEGILFETVHRRKDGTTFPVEISSKGATINGMRTLISTGRDITERKRSEAALAESEARLRLALDSAQMGIWELNLKTNRVAWDGANQGWAGIKPDPSNRTVESFYEFVHPEDRVPVREATRKAVECRRPYGVEFRIIRPDGELLWMRSQGRVICDPGDQPSRILGVVWDISHLKHSEQKLLEATARLDFLVTESPAVVFTYELLPQPHLNYISRNVETILGWKPDWFTGNFERWKECLHPADLPVVSNGLAELERTGKQVFEYRFKDTNGRYHWIHDEQRVIVREDGRKEMIGAWWDVTDAKAAQEELRRLAAVIEQAAEMVVMTDEKAEIVYANPAFEKITGYSQMEVLGKNPRILKSGEHDRAFYRQMWASLSSGKTWHGRIVNKKKDGRLYTEEATISPVLGPFGDIVNYVAVKRDITREQALEQQYLEAQKMEAIGTLAGGIAHDFNNILGIILANAQILEFSGAISSESKETLDQIITASKRARELVRQILAFSRRGKQEKIIMNLKPVVKETFGLLRASLPATIRLEPHIAADTGMLFADPTQMQQVLMNLCTNAAHAMEKEGGVLKIALSNASIDENDAPLEPGFVPGEYVKLSVSDTGHGMQPWILKKIFEPYFTTKETGKGTGLGLSVVHGIVKSHGGTIMVSSIVWKGSIFEIYLPRIKGEASETDEFDMPLLTGKGRILFVDDEPSLTLTGQKILGRLGYRVQTTNSSVEALEVFRSKPNEFDLVITDLTMPELTGVQLAKELLEIRPGLPIVLCTGFSDQVTDKMLQSIGIRGLLLKPLTIHELAHAVRMAIEVKP